MLTMHAADVVNTIVCLTGLTVSAVVLAVGTYRAARASSTRNP